MTSDGPGPGQVYALEAKKHIATLRQALALVEGHPATRARAVVLTSLASSLMHVADIEAARTTAEVAVRAAVAAGAGDEEADALITLGTARAYAEDMSGGLDALRAADRWQNLRASQGFCEPGFRRR